MTRDYAKPSTTRKPGSKSKKKKPAKPRASAAAKPSAPPPRSKSKFLHIVLIGLILGGFGFALFKLAQVPEKASSNSASTSTVQKNTVTPKPKQEQAKPEARFQFYDLLQNSEVETDTVDAYTFKEKGKAEEYQYMLQTGSFRSPQDAERQKATIAFQGLKASIRVVTNDSGSTWHRVETGPFQSRSEMNAALDKLYAINIQPLVKKSKK